MSNTIDLFTRKSVEELEALKNKSEEEYKEIKRSQFQMLIDIQQELLDNDELEGLMLFACLTNGSELSPLGYSPTKAGWLHLNYLADAAKDLTLTTLAYGTEEEDD